MAPSLTRRLLGSALLTCLTAMAAQSAELTIDRLFDAPELAGPGVVGLKVSPQGGRVTFLRGKAGNKDRLDLWEFNVSDGSSHLLVDSNELAGAEKPLSDEEKGRRERQRTAALSGIVEYTFAPKGDALLFPLNGQLFYYRLAGKNHASGVELVSSSGFVTDATVSPDGSHVAYIRDQNLMVYDLGGKKERALTTDGGGTIKNGMAEFVAQEEMDRTTGYWWSPDGRHIAFARVDESPVKETQRFEIAADNVATFSQRYPAAGGPNVLVRVGVVDIRNGSIVWIDLG